ncbi:hypothetical protein VTN77DRAFT_9042 [Rasamsonia byssochlamydoides]|uniref:uncharacterized protein n=1 Tax=Rasamsonia byssochlamydoides TaxID=89139 RepID=UPI0037449F8A
MTASFAPEPLKTIEWNKLGTNIIEVNGHVESRYSAQTGEWSAPEFVKDPYLKIHGLAPALNYGQQAYEGIKAFRNPQGEVQIFRPDFHATRFAHSSAFVSIPPMPNALFVQCVELAVSRNAEFVPPHDTEALLYIRPVVFGSAPQIALMAPSEFTFCVYVAPGNSYHGIRPLDALVMDEFNRAAPKGTGSAKVGGNYAPVIRWQDKARAQGFPLTLHLDSKTGTEIEEFSTSAFIGVIAGEEDSRVGCRPTRLVVPESQNIIDSVTSDSCTQIAKSLGWIVEKRAIPYDSISEFSEVIAAGTAASLVPVRSISRITTTGKTTTTTKVTYLPGGNNAEPGPVTAKLSQLLKDIQKGKVPDSFGWCYKVRAL